jgi:DNA-binding response OmpR family regulator
MILLVTHEVEFAKHVGCLLEAHGYSVMLASRGSDVATVMTQGNPQLIIVNLYLRNPSGLEILRELRARGYAGKIIVLAGNSVSSEIPQALCLGIDQVIGQPVSFNQILSAVRVAIGPPGKNEDHVAGEIAPFAHLASMP